jgi:hypothetical protein
MPSWNPRLAGLLTVLISCSLIRPAVGLLGQNEEEYYAKYGKPTHQVGIDPRYSSYLFKKKPYMLIVVFQDHRSIGEIISKTGGLTSADIASILNAAADGSGWRKERIHKRKGDEEKMRAQGVLDVQIWSRQDGKAFASYLHAISGPPARSELKLLLIGNKRGLQLLTQIANNRHAWPMTPIP